jgi:hypothetical protein
LRTIALALSTGIAIASVAGAASGTASSGMAPGGGATSAERLERRLCEATSPAHRVALVELFTSEGCSSCPPADRWLSSLAGAGVGFDRVVPLALHVGYWDYIGWKDPYAKPVFTDRQRRYARARGAGSVYTPQVVLDGRDYRAWGAQAGFERDVAAINAQPAPVRLSLAAARSGDTLTVRVQALPGTPSGPSEPGDTLTLAVFEDGLSSPVTRGENAGATLRHDRVVRQWVGQIPFDAAAPAVERRIDLPAGLRSGRAGVAAFVQRADGAVLQAVACASR